MCFEKLMTGTVPWHPVLYSLILKTKKENVELVN